MRTERQAIIVVGLGYGDEGKGTITDFLVREHEAKLVVRHNGGAQAAHNVVTPDGRHHTFRQWGSGTFVSGCRTLLSRFCVAYPFAMMKEAEQLEAVGVSDPWSLLVLDERALIISPFHEAMNRLRELARGDNRHGSCGVGVGETVSDSIQFPDDTISAHMLADRETLTRRLTSIRDRKVAEIKSLTGHFIRDYDLKNKDLPAEIRLLLDPEVVPMTVQFYMDVAKKLRILRAEEEKDFFESFPKVVFEGAQGVLLDEWYGFHPYTTWSTTTSANAHVIIRDDLRWDCQASTIGVLRAYSTRHGAGPFVTEDNIGLDEIHNKTGPWQGRMRTGWFDAVAARYAIQADPHIDCLAITHIDQLETLSRPLMCYSYMAGPSPISDMKLGHKGDLKYQEALTAKALKLYKPQYTEFATFMSQPEELSRRFLQTIHRELGRHVLIESRGPKATDKRWRIT